MTSPPTLPLPFPADFDPFTATDAEVAELVRRLWTDPAKDQLGDEYAKWSASVDAAAGCPW